MNSFRVFLKKELVEFIKTWKLLIMLLLFLSSSVLAPVLAYFTPMLMEMSGFEMGGAAGEVYNQTMESSYTLYYSNQMQMGLLTVVFITCLAVVREKSKGTAVLTLTKNISRRSFILAKFTSYTIWYSAVFVISYLAFALLTQIIFGASMTKDALFSMLVFYLPGLLFVASSIFASCISKNTLISCLIGFGFFALIFILSAIPFINKFTPGMLINNAITILNGNYDNTLIPLITTFAAIVLFTFFGILSFEKQEL